MAGKHDRRRALRQTMDTRRTQRRSGQGRWRAGEAHRHERRVGKVQRARGIILGEVAHAESSTKHEPLTRAVGVAQSRLELFPVGLHAGYGANAKCVGGKLIIGALASRALELADVIPAQANIERQLARGMPIVLDEKVRLPSPVVLKLIRILPCDGCRDALEEVRQTIGRRALSCGRGRALLHGNFLCRSWI